MPKKKSAARRAKRPESPKFGLLIQKRPLKEGYDVEVTSKNDGIPDAEVILLVEAWLENARNTYLDNVFRHE